MGRVIDIDALTIGGLEALANERGMRLITKEAYNEMQRRGQPIVTIREARDFLALRAAPSLPEPSDD